MRRSHLLFVPSVDFGCLDTGAVNAFLEKSLDIEPLAAAIDASKGFCHLPSPLLVKQLGTSKAKVVITPLSSLRRNASLNSSPMATQIQQLQKS